MRQEGRGPQIIISRSHPDYLKALFHQEVPEISDGIVQIMGAARDPGKRAKLAVISRENEVDPVGSCVGVRGSRIHNIVQELRGERVDIFFFYFSYQLVIAIREFTSYHKFLTTRGS